MPSINIQGVIAVLVVIGCFALLGVYVVRGQAPDGVVIAVVSGSIMAVLGFYFGHANGTTSALAAAATVTAMAATNLVNQTKIAPVPAVTTTVVPVAPPS